MILELNLEGQVNHQKIEKSLGRGNNITNGKENREHGIFEKQIF